MSKARQMTSLWGYLDEHWATSSTKLIASKVPVNYSDKKWVYKTQSAADTVTKQPVVLRNSVFSGKQGMIPAHNRRI